MYLILVTHSLHICTIGYAIGGAVNLLIGRIGIFTISLLLHFSNSHTLQQMGTQQTEHSEMFQLGKIPKRTR